MASIAEERQSPEKAWFQQYLASRARATDEQYDPTPIAATTLLVEVLASLGKAGVGTGEVDVFVSPDGGIDVSVFARERIVSLEVEPSALLNALVIGRESGELLDISLGVSVSEATDIVREILADLL